jgi:hypothetical protein
MSSDLGDFAAQLTALAEQLADLALDRLRRAADPDDPTAESAAAEERQITRARRAVERAALLLTAADGSGDG